MRISSFSLNKSLDHKASFYLFEIIEDMIEGANLSAEKKSERKLTRLKDDSWESTKAIKAIIMVKITYSYKDYSKSTN